MKTLIFEGNLELSETDSGFLPCSIEIDEDDLDRLIAKATNCYVPNDKGYSLIDGGPIALGKVKITIELFDYIDGYMWNIPESVGW